MSISAPPGPVVNIRDTPIGTGAPTGTGAAFMPAITERGPLVPVRVESIGQFQRVFGVRQSDTPAYDAADIFFREGGAVMWVSRVVGPAALAASTVMNDAASAPSITVAANSPGAWGNDLKVEVVTGDQAGEFRLIITRGGVEVERSPSLTDPAAAAAWSTTSSVIVVTAVGTSDPAVAAATSLAGGTDDRASATDTSWKTALDRMGRDLGAGQVLAPGRTTQAAHEQLLAHASATNRFALLDAPDTATVGTLTSTAKAVMADGAARWGAMFAPWLVVGPAAGMTGTRTIPPSVVEAALISRADAQWGPGQAPAGDFGVSRTVIDIPIAWSDDDRATLNDGNVNVFREVWGTPKAYGIETLVDSDALPGWAQIGQSRVAMALRADCYIVGERHVGAKIDGEGLRIGQYGAELGVVCDKFWRRGDMYGRTADEAFRVDVGPTVNTPETIAAGVLKSVISFRSSPSGVHVEIELVHRTVMEAV